LGRADREQQIAKPSRRAAIRWIPILVEAGAKDQAAAEAARAAVNF